MTIDQLLETLTNKRISLAIDGDDLAIRGEKRALDASLVAALRANKSALLDLIKGGAYSNPSAAFLIPPNLIASENDTLTPEMLTLVQLTQDEIDGIVAGVPGGVRNIQDIYPLAPLQEGVFFHHLTSDEGDPYLTQSACRFDSRERLDAFVQALQNVIDRHDTLRTSLFWEGLAEPVQVVHRRALLSVEEVALDPAAGDVAAQLVAAFSPRRHRMDIRSAPLVCLKVAREAECTWVAVLLLHHLIVDHTALDILLEEIEVFWRGGAHSLPKPVPFRNFVARARLSVPRDEHELFFGQLLGDVDETTAPFGYTDVLGDGSQIVEAHREIDASLARRLRSSARANGVSAATLCHVAWGRVLAALSGRDDVVFGTVMFGRMQSGEGADRVLGPLMNTLPVRMRMLDRTVRVGVREMQELLAALLQHEHAPLSLAQRCSGVPASAPLFTALLNHRHTPELSSKHDDMWNGVQLLRTEERSNYPLTLSINDSGEGLSLSAQVHQSIDPEGICDYMAVALQNLVAALERSDEVPLSDVAILPSDERDRIVEQWNRTARSYPADRCVHELFETQVAASPNAVAVTYEDAQLTYGELNASANQLARFLRTVGVGPECRVGVCFERGLDLIVALLAVFKAGGAYVPLDPSYPSQRLRDMLEDSAPICVLTHGSVATDVRALLEDWKLIDLGRDSAQWVDADVADLALGALDPTHLAYMIYTSGSTGKAKAVMVEHRHLTAKLLATQEELGFRCGDVFPSIASFAFDIALLEQLLPLVNGGQCLLLGHRTILEMPALVEATMSASFFHAVPSLMGLWLDALPEDAAAIYPNLRCLLVGGEAVSERLLRRLLERFPLASVVELYGPTEATIISTFLRADSELPDGVSHCIGHHFDRVRTYILDERLEPVPVGITGELHIGGASIARGYWNRPELTAERFVASPFTIGDRLYKTGDLARYLPDGMIEFLGRSDFQVKIRGFRIELGEIEAGIGRYPGIGEAAVEFRAAGGSEKQLVAYFTVRDEERIDTDALRAFVQSLLPEYMLPSAYIELESFPLSSNGKLDRRALPDPDRRAYVSRVYEAPVGESETEIAKIWCDILGVDSIGRNDNFFERGGHSLLAVRAQELMRRAGLRMDVRMLYATPTLRGLAESVQTTPIVHVPEYTILESADKITPEMLNLWD